MALAGIIYLIIATICAAMFSVMFKIFHIKGVDSGQAIFFNYLTAFILGILFSLHGELVVNPFKAHWLVPVLILGLIFMAGMILLSDSTRSGNLHSMQPCINGDTHNCVFPPH